MTTDNQPALQPPELIEREFDHFSIVPFKAICGADRVGQSTTQDPRRAKCAICWQYWKEWDASFDFEARAPVVDGVVATADQFIAWINNYWPDWRKGSQAKVELMRAAWDAATRLANFNEMALKGCHEYTVELEKVQALAYQMARHIRNTDEIPAPQWGVEGIFLLEQLHNVNPEQYEHEVKRGAPVPAQVLTDLQQAVIDHDDDMARLDRNTLAATAPIAAPVAHTTTSAASLAMKAAEAIAPHVDPFFRLNRDWQERVAAIIERAYEPETPSKAEDRNT